MCNIRRTLVGNSLQEKRNHESALEKIMRIIDEIGFVDLSFLFNNSRLFDCNVRPACLLTPPPLGNYTSCPSVTDVEGEVCATLQNIALLAFTSAGINCHFNHRRERVVALSRRCLMIFEWMILPRSAGGL
jgi:hypothetical protein